MSFGIANLYTNDYFLAVAAGKVSGVEYLKRYARNLVIGTSMETFWSLSTSNKTWPVATAVDVKISSGSTADDFGSTGALTLDIFGIADGGDYAEDLGIIMDGRTLVAADEFLHIDWMEVATAGSGGVNAGIIYAFGGATGTVDGSGVPTDSAEILATIPIGANASQDATYTVPNGKVLYIFRHTLMSATAKIYQSQLRIRATAAGVFVAEDTLDINLNKDGNEFLVPLKVDAGGSVDIQVLAGGDNGIAAGAFEGLLVDIDQN